MGRNRDESEGLNERYIEPIDLVGIHHQLVLG